jgi:hypothetical protein
MVPFVDDSKSRKSASVIKDGMSVASKSAAPQDRLTDSSRLTVTKLVRGKYADNKYGSVTDSGAVSAKKSSAATQPIQVTPVSAAIQTADFHTDREVHAYHSKQTVAKNSANSRKSSVKDAYLPSISTGIVEVSSF